MDKTEKTKEPKEMTREEKQVEIDAEKKAAWENFQKLDYNTMNDKDRISSVRNLYETMTTRLAPETIDIPYDFWKEYENTDEIKDINRFKDHVENTLARLPKNPTKESWLDKNRGIVPNMKKEWKTKLEPFKTDRVIRERVTKNAHKIFNLPENKDKEFSVSMDSEMAKALEDIEKNVYLPVRSKIEKIEEEIKSRV